MAAQIFSKLARAAAEIAANPEKTDRAIASELSMSHTTVFNARKASGIKRPRRADRDVSEMRTISRRAAKLLGLKYYFIGKACRYGHIAEHRVSDYKCIVCEKLRFAGCGPTVMLCRGCHREFLSINAMRFCSNPCKRRHKYTSANLEKRRARQRERNRKMVASFRAIRQLGINL